MLALMAVLTTAASSPAPAPVPSLNQTVQTRLMPQTEALLVKLMTEKRDLVVDGQRVFNSGDKFLPGKIADGMAYLILATPRDDPRFARYVSGFRELSRLTLDDPLDTWGIYYYTAALYQLQQAGLLEACVDAGTLAALKVKLDWRSFVRTDLSLINLPNNYYGVAFAIAGMRHKLGWEDDSGMNGLVAKVLGHYRTFSESGFADETDGNGRFDRYSVLLIGEIAHHYVEIGLSPPPEVKAWLRGSAEVALNRLNAQGDGFEYGRSIGAYGDTALVELVTIAAYLNVLTPEEKEAAYAFASVAAHKYMSFWVDADTGSVNLWDKGRRTDAYRGKHRILGENLSLAQQYAYTNALWNEMGYAGRAPSADLGAWRRSRPELTTTWFARGAYDRALITRRDGHRLIGLPLINGGDGQHMNAPYYPIPFSPGLVAGVADSSLPQLLPQVRLVDGAKLAPLAYFRHVQVKANKGGATVTYDQDQVDRLGQAKPQADTRLKAKTVYRFTTGSMTRTDLLKPVQALDVESIDIEFASYSPMAKLTREGNRWIATYAAGDALSFSVSGFTTCTLQSVDGWAYQTTSGPFASTMRCSTGKMKLRAPLTLSWTLRYD